jgi:hypothetical protein
MADTDRGPNQDAMPQGGQAEKTDATYRDATYLGTSEDDEEEVRDLGFIVEDHDDRRAHLTGGWQRLDDLDTNEPLETNRSGPIPHETALRERGASEEWFATDFHVSHADAEAQEEDFVETSMLGVDPEMNEGDDDFTDESIADIHGVAASTDIYGQVAGVGAGLGTSVPQDLGRGGFQIRENPLASSAGEPVSGDLLSDDAMALRDGDGAGSEAAQEALAERAAQDAERGGKTP